MTLLGQMLVNDGIEKGRSETLRELAIEMRKTESHMRKLPGIPGLQSRRFERGKRKTGMMLPSDFKICSISRFCDGTCNIH